MATKLLMTVEEMKDRDKWLKFRNLGIGGSEAAVIVGMNKWKSPFQLWLEKREEVEPEDLSDNEYVYWGNVLEQVVADRFCELTGKKVQRRGLLQSEEYPFMLASVDRMVVGENAGLECKTANGFAGKQWEGDEVPDAYYIQCQHYMAVTGCERWYIAVLIGGNKFIWKCIERNQHDIDILIEAEKDFWNKVQFDIMPEVDGSENCKSALNERFEGGCSEPVELDNEAVYILGRIDELETLKNEVVSEIDEKKNKLRLMLGNNEIGLVGDRKVTWKTQAGRTTIDSKKLKADLPDVFSKYAKTGNESRVLRIS